MKNDNKHEPSILDILIAKGMVHIFVECSDCHLADSCENKCIGCCNWSNYKKSESADD